MLDAIWSHYDRPTGTPRWGCTRDEFDVATSEVIARWHTKFWMRPSDDMIDALEDACKPLLIRQPTEEELRVILGCPTASPHEK